MKVWVWGVVVALAAACFLCFGASAEQAGVDYSTLPEQYTALEDTWLGVGYLHINDWWQLSCKNDVLVGVVHNLNDLTISHKIVVLDERLLDVDLLESLGVHEVCTKVILVGELVWTTLNAYLLDLDTYRREGILENATVLQVLELRTNECWALARLAVLEIDNNKCLAIHLDAHTDFDISSCNCHSCIVLIISEFQNFGCKDTKKCRMQNAKCRKLRIKSCLPSFLDKKSRYPKPDVPRRKIFYNIVRYNGL